MLASPPFYLYYWSGDAAPDVIPAVVLVQAPANNAVVSGTVSIQIIAVDDRGVVSVQPRVNGTPYGNPLTTQPYIVTWDTRFYGNGPHVISATAADLGGNIGSATPIRVTVANPQGRKDVEQPIRAVRGKAGDPRLPDFPPGQNRRDFT